jgi:NHLM bacteriocin system ABC transporter peptidase/ATP-binding protein
MLGIKKSRVKTPTIIQMEAVECGAAALAIVLAYYGRHVSLEELRVSCGISRDGSKASNLLRAARNYGLEAKAFRAEPLELPKMKLPVIVHWEHNHFLVVEGFKHNKVYLNDPSSGPRWITTTEFDGSFTGIVIAASPAPNFSKGGSQFNLTRSLYQRLKGSKVGLLYVVLAGLALVFPGLLIPVFNRLFVDYYLIQGEKSWIGALLIGIALTALMRGLLTWLKEYHLLRLETKLAISMSGKFFWHVLRLPLEFYYQRYAGEIGSRVVINDQIAYLLSGKIASTVLDVVTVVFFAILMFIYDPLLAMVAIVFALLNFAALRYVSRKRTDINQRLLQERGKFTGVVMSGLQTIETLKSSGRESDFFSRLTGQQAEMERSEQKMDLYGQSLAVVPVLLAALNTTAILTVGGLRVIDEQLTVGMLVAFQSLALSFTAPISKLLELGANIQEAVGGLNRLDDVFANPVILSEFNNSQEVTKHLPKLSGELELRGITFGYSRLEPPLLQNFNLTLKPGSRVALVGTSGSGKSTVAKLVAGLYSPWNGTVLFDGQSRQQLPKHLLNNSLAMIDQDIFIFAGTIRENLTLWDSTISDTQVIQAAKDACIHLDIATRPNGYHGEVIENGANFSGGQRQRLEIARALVLNPTLLVLDEATSALDPLTEQIIDENIRRRGCTCLIIAHRLSTIRDCDEIIVMERGQIVQRGTHDQLKAVPGQYARLIEN